MNEFNLKKVFNWQKASEPIVKKYVADLHQTGTDAPVATELYNDTDVSFTYEYFGNGVYGVRASKPIFSGCGMGCPPGQKAQAFITNCSFETTYSFAIFPGANDLFVIFSSTGDGALGDFSQNAIEITIYP
jgi:hypothetical protein